MKDILDCLGTSLSDFFADEQEAVVFTEDDTFEKESEGCSVRWLVPTSQKNAMEPIITVLNKGASTDEDFPHEGEEFGYVLEGRIAIEKAGKRHNAKKGESFYFTANKEHRIINTGKSKARFIWISTPPNF